MPDSLLCIDIQHDYVASILVEKNAKSRVVIGCGFSHDKTLDMAQAIAQALSATGFSRGASLVTFGAQFFTYRNITLPFSDRKKIEQILPFELESRSAVDVDDLIFDFNIGQRRAEGTDVIVAMIQKEVLSKHLEVLVQAGVDPEKIGISGFALTAVLPPESTSESVVLDFAGGWATLFLKVGGVVCLVRSIPAPSPDPESLQSFLFNVRQTFFYFKDGGLNVQDFDLYLSGALPAHSELIPSMAKLFQADRIHNLTCSTMPFVKIDSSVRDDFQPGIMDRLLADVLKGKKAWGDFNFRKEEFKPRKSAEYKIRLAAKLSVPLLALILFVSAYLFYGYGQLKEKQRELDLQIRGVFSETLPEITRVVNPLHQMQIIINDMQKTFRPGGKGSGSHSIVTLLTELSARIPERYSFKVVKMVVEKETIRLKAETGDFNIVDSIKKELGKSALFSEVVIASANQSSKADKIVCELKITIAE